MVQKRPFVEEVCDVSPKHLRLEHGTQLLSFLELPFKDVSQGPCMSEGERCVSKCTTESDDKLENGKIIEFPTFTEQDTDVFPGNNPNSSWPSSSLSEEDVRLDAPFHILSPQQELYSPVRPSTPVKQPEDAYSYLFKRPPLKRVPVGPDFQANVPKWCGHAAKNVSIFSDAGEKSEPTSQASESNLVICAKDEITLMGSCIIPMADAGSVACDNNDIGSGRTECFCKDSGSTRCVRQHIREASVNLRRTVGLERFLELGFDNMGEIVAEKWSDEDEQVFHEVVFSYPASLGKNFWDRLALVFPSLTNKEIVSYYFNVFMLRKRADQNRCDPLDIDSDNDEWEVNDESEEDESLHRNEVHEDESYDHDDESFEDPTFDHHGERSICGFKGCTNVSETWPMMLPDNSCFETSPQASEKTLTDGTGDYDFQDDSCTSLDTSAVPLIGQVKVDVGKHWSSPEYVLEPCDAKVWDGGYFTRPRTETDFLPTYTMMEEIFGVEAWKHEDGAGKD